MTDVDSPARSGRLVRVSVVAGDRRLDIGAPGAVALAELVPGLARSLGLLDVGSAHGGYRLLDPTGRVLDQDRSLQAQSVPDGAVLSLQSAVDLEATRRYDDVVEAVADVIESEHEPWTATDSARTALGVATALLLTGGALLLISGFTPLAGAAVAGAIAVLILVAAGVLERLDHGRLPSSASSTLGILGCALAAVAGFIGTSPAMPAGAVPPPNAAGLVGAGGAVLVAAAVVVAVAPRAREAALAPAVPGALAVAIGAVTLLMGDGAAPTASVVAFALLVVLLVAVPWLALASTPIRVITPREDAEIYADVPPVDLEGVRADARRGHRLQLAMRAGGGLTMVALTPGVVGTGLTGLFVVAAGYAAVLLSIRESYPRTDVAAVTVASVLGLLVGGITAAIGYPSWRPALVGALTVAAAMVVAVGLLAPGRRLRLARAADTAALVCLALVPPLAVLAAGLA